uniref:Uncharacterized protein n=1 Tax=Setaria italica TaxID=4555 RepID=K3ZGR7_SETIT
MSQNHATCYVLHIMTINHGSMLQCMGLGKLVFMLSLV